MSTIITATRRPKKKERKKEKERQVGIQLSGLLHTIDTLSDCFLKQSLYHGPGSYCPMDLIHVFVFCVNVLWLVVFCLMKLCTLWVNFVRELKQISNVFYGMNFYVVCYEILCLWTQCT